MPGVGGRLLFTCNFCFHLIFTFSYTFVLFELYIICNVKMKFTCMCYKEKQYAVVERTRSGIIDLNLNLGF